MISHPTGKRVFDIAAAAAGLVLAVPLFVVIAVLIKLDSRGPIFFTQERIGLRFRRFRIYKFRTMVQNAAAGAPITCGADPRVTRVGRLLRGTKLDELPQLINILAGEMSVVGPRPELPRYVELFRKDYSEILNVRPGLTDFASLKYRDEATLLGRSANPQEEYVRRILPDKIGLARQYIQDSSFLTDLALIFRTLIRIGRRQPG
jgi:lipopolysaccharide/colanic/teichoic acid biosynthesis glycosyltransferase